MKDQATITHRGRTRYVVLQQRIDREGGYWATTHERNSNTGWSLKGNGTVRRERYHAQTNECVESKLLQGATWQRVA